MPKHTANCNAVRIYHSSGINAVFANWRSRKLPRTRLAEEAQVVRAVAAARRRTSDVIDLEKLSRSLARA